MIDEAGAKDVMFPVGGNNLAICFSGIAARASFCVLAVSGIADLHFGASVDGYQQAPLYRYGQAGRAENVTDWALEQFRKHYRPGRLKKDRALSKEAIFHYVYAVLHDPIYREKYASNLKREFPRIPFYADFWRWVDWGEALMDLHIDFESVEPAQLARADQVDEKARSAGQSPKPLLKADRVAGVITLDSETTLSGVPKSAWSYVLGNRSAIDWVLDQYKEKKPKDPTIREKFNTYRFADYKEKVIDLIGRVTTVSVRTTEIVEAMRGSAR